MPDNALDLTLRALYASTLLDLLLESFVRVPKRFFGVFALGNIHHEGDLFLLTIEIDDLGRIRKDGTRCSILPDDLPLAAQFPFTIEELIVQLRQLLPVAFRHDHSEVSADQFVSAVLIEAQVLRIDILEAALAVRYANADRCVLHDTTQTFFRAVRIRTCALGVFMLRADSAVDFIEHLHDLPRLRRHFSRIKHLVTILRDGGKHCENIKSMLRRIGH